MIFLDSELKEFKELMDLEVKKHEYISDNPDPKEINAIISKKNLYEMHARGISSKKDFNKEIIDKHISESRETKFGHLFEKLVRAIIKKKYNNVEEGRYGVDVSYIDQNGIPCFMEIKSGPNWANASQIKQLEQNFSKIKENFPNQEIHCINGCCYGQTDRNPNKGSGDGSYIKLCGQELWELLTDDKDFYKKIKDLITINNENNDIILDGWLRNFPSEYLNQDNTINYDVLIEKFYGSKKYKEQEYINRFPIEIGKIANMHSNKPLLKEFVFDRVFAQLGANQSEYEDIKKCYNKYVKENFSIKKGKLLF